MLFLIVGAWHFWLYIHKAQGLDYKYNGRWLASRNSTFLFGNRCSTTSSGMSRAPGRSGPPMKC